MSARGRTGRGRRRRAQSARVAICFEFDSGPPLIMDVPRDIVPKELFALAKRSWTRKPRRGGGR